MPHELREGPYLVSDDPEMLNTEVIHGFLSRSYWARGIPIETVRRSMEGSLNFGAYHASTIGKAEQIGFTRVISDHATFAYICDVFVLEDHRGRGMSKMLMRAALTHPKLQGLRRWMLVTRDADSLYAKFGFTRPPEAQIVMHKVDPEIYLRGFKP